MALLGRERQPFVGLVIAGVIGIAAADFFAVLTWPTLAIAICGALAALRYPFRPLVLAIVATTFFCLHSARVTNSPAEKLAAITGVEIRPANITGVVTSEPKVEPNGVAQFLLRLKNVGFDGETHRSDASVYAHWRERPQIGDVVTLFGTLQPIEPPRNPGEFDMRAYLARRGITRELVVRYPENGRIIGSRFSLLAAAARSRAWMQRTLSRGIEDSPEVVGLICGTSLGLRHQTRDDIEEPFQQTGTLHLFAVAGLHVGIVAWLLWTIASVFRLPRKPATALIILLLFFYAAITGLHIASIRAAVMSAVLMAGVFFDRRVLALNSLAAAAFLILICDSNQLFSSGFQLSFCVVGAIIIFAGPMYRAFRRIGQPDPFMPRGLISLAGKLRMKIGNALARGASVSVAAWVGSLPCVYWYFHLITPVALIANLAVVPIAYFVLALALLSLVTAPFSSALSVVFNNANWLMSRAVLALVHLFATFPAGHFYLPHFGASHARTMITVLDEGTGAAAHLRAHGYDWLIDCGGDRNYERTLKAYLHDRGLNRLEGMLLTHGDSQHVGAASDVVEDFSPREIFDNPLSVRSVLQQRFRGRFAPRPLMRDDALLFGRSVHAKILYPPPHLKIEAADDAPIVFQLTIGENISVLFESDAGEEAEEALLNGGDDLKSDILIKGQHHSGDSGIPEFLEAVDPALIVATSRDLPAAEKISDDWAGEVARRGIKLFRQDQTGAVEIEFHGHQWRARSYVTGEVFRHSSR